MSKWPDFLFTGTIRFAGGIFVGCLACLLFTYRGILDGFSHDNVGGPILWLILCSLLGGFVAVFTIPHWQTPWYKGIQKRKYGAVSPRPTERNSSPANDPKGDNIRGPGE